MNDDPSSANSSTAQPQPAEDPTGQQQPSATMPTNATADGNGVVALVHARGNPGQENGKLRPGPRGGMLKTGGKHPGSGRPTSWLRAEMRKGLAHVIRIVNEAVKTGERPNGGKMTMDDYERAGNFLGRFGVGVPVEVQTSDDQPFTVVLGVFHGGALELPAAAPELPPASSEGRQSA